MSQAGAFSSDLLLDTFLREHGPEALEVPGVTELTEDEDPGSSLYRHVPGPCPLPLRVGGLWAVLTGAALGSPGRALEQTPPGVVTEPVPWAGQLHSGHQNGSSRLRRGCVLLLVATVTLSRPLKRWIQF